MSTESSSPNSPAPVFPASPTPAEPHDSSRLMCNRCHKNPGRGPSRLCNSCRRTLRRQEKRERLKEAGLCSRCGNQRPAAGRIICQSCIDTNQRVQKRWREARIADHKCIQCPRPSAGPGATLCRHCRDRKLRGAAAVRQRRRDNHQCTRCGSALGSEHPYKSCARCRERDAKGRERRVLDAAHAAEVSHSVNPASHEDDSAMDCEENSEPGT
jgi:hypothetical protein